MHQGAVKYRLLGVHACSREFSIVIATVSQCYQQICFVSPCPASRQNRFRCILLFFSLCTTTTTSTRNRMCKIRLLHECHVTKSQIDRSATITTPDWYFIIYYNYYKSIEFLNVSTCTCTVQCSTEFKKWYTKLVD